MEYCSAQARPPKNIQSTTGKIYFRLFSARECPKGLPDSLLCWLAGLTDYELRYYVDIVYLMQASR